MFHLCTQGRYSTMKPLYCRPVSPMIMNVNILSKILANQIHHHIKSIIHCDKWDFPWDVRVVQHMLINKYGYQCWGNKEMGDSGQRV